MERADHHKRLLLRHESSAEEHNNLVSVHAETSPCCFARRIARRIVLFLCFASGVVVSQLGPGVYDRLFCEECGGIGALVHGPVELIIGRIDGHVYERRGFHRYARHATP